MTGVAPETQLSAQRQLALVDLLDRLLAGGVVIRGDLTLRIADVDLVRVDLNALISSVGPGVGSPFEPMEERTPFEEREPFDERARIEGRA
ncbi:gas vesicle protein [Streptomyces sp. NPDC057445]|uniref:gas vesicle protein n=1 Tax=Streptomyces sp. NPDC057445 TaxID=3346136 RepID=UPI0036B0996E